MTNGLEEARRRGSSEAELLRGCTTLRAADPANARAFVRSHYADFTRRTEANEPAGH